MNSSVQYPPVWTSLSVNNFIFCFIKIVDEAEICLNGTISQAANGKESLKDAWTAVQKEVISLRIAKYFLPCQVNQALINCFLVIGQQRICFFCKYVEYTYIV